MPGSDKTKRYPFNHLKAVRHLKRCDAHFEHLIGRVGRFRMEMDTHASPYDALIEAIIYQQLHGKGGGDDLEAAERSDRRRRFSDAAANSGGDRCATSSSGTVAAKDGGDTRPRAENN